MLRCCATPPNIFRIHRNSHTLSERIPVFERHNDFKTFIPFFREIMKLLIFHQVLFDKKRGYSQTMHEKGLRVFMKKFEGGMPGKRTLNIWVLRADIYIYSFSHDNLKFVVIRSKKYQLVFTMIPVRSMYSLPFVLCAVYTLLNVGKKINYKHTCWKFCV